MSRTDEIVHRCHARGCTTPVPPEMLMCKTHWFMVPAKIRRAVWATYRPGQCDDKQPSEAWHVAADAAIGHVAWQTGEPLTPNEVSALGELGFQVREKKHGVKVGVEVVPALVPKTKGHR